jgi:hypothetical protein
MQRLVFSTISAGASFVLGFAWKSDSTVQQDHPAYYMWHRLSDHRLEINLRPFGRLDVLQALTIFEQELGDNLLPELRRQLIENSRGYPWLLKKLCIHVYEQINSGIAQGELIDRALDVQSLFERDLQKLSHSERICLNLIAHSAPANWYEILESSGTEVLRALVDKRLVVRSGDRVNVYWDIFREYVLTNTAPSIPLSYLPASTIQALLRTSRYLNHNTEVSKEELASRLAFTEKSAGNVIRDLVMFGVAKRTGRGVVLEDAIDEGQPPQVLARLRHVLRRHALTLRLDCVPVGSVLTSEDLAAHLKEAQPTAQHRQKTWHVYADRLGQWLSVAGLLRPVEGGWIRDDIGTFNFDIVRYRPKSIPIFLGDAPPATVIETLAWLYSATLISSQEVNRCHLRNAMKCLVDFRLATLRNGSWVSTRPIGFGEGDPLADVWNAVREHHTVKAVCEYLLQHPTASGRELGRYLDSRFDRNWSANSMVRIGNALRKWGFWVLSDSGSTSAPQPPVRRNSNRLIDSQPSLFD